MQPSNGNSRQIKILKSATSLVPLCHVFPGVKTEKYGYRPIFFNELFFSISLSTVRNIIPLKQDPEAKPIFRGSLANIRRIIGKQNFGFACWVSLSDFLVEN